MRRWSEYKAIIVDLDGTLYYQKPMRIAMVVEMLLNFWLIGDFLIVKKYRELYEAGLQEKERFDRLPNRAPKIIQEWMIDRPQRHIRKYRDRSLIALLQKVQQNDVKIIVYSDYPVKDKLKALCFSPNHAYDSNDIGCLKPDARGILKVLEEQNISVQECLVIGDRYKKDGILAENMGSDYIILPSDMHGREKIYRGQNLLEIG